MSNTNSAHKTINPRSYDDLLAVVASIKSQLGDKAHAKVGIICGSGLAPIADQVEDQSILPYESIPGFPSVSVNSNIERMYQQRVNLKAEKL
ncbi:hypothetical protein DICVIV_04639 [Dictyocaulus viviparus]|uniref:Purine-nucleoside phosphorylase n=1 Tax=Dictyocaulus viviparus TaxID=29172 RepID=A0A0D8XZN1_DICVI|nr:hypothetical protein DICVIV_04639 [Dictyocaulus viviparus]